MLKFRKLNISISWCRKGGHGIPVSKNTAIVWQKLMRMRVGAARVDACSWKLPLKVSSKNMSPIPSNNSIPIMTGNVSSVHGQGSHRVSNL